MLELIKNSYLYRELIWILAMKELKIRYKRSALGFVWALLHPLLIDEILSVGDAPFQEKSFQRMMNFNSKSCTIVLVSHNAEMIERICQRAIFLDHGKLFAEGPTNEVIARYQEFCQQAVNPPAETAR